MEQNSQNRFLPRREIEPPISRLTVHYADHYAIENLYLKMAASTILVQFALNMTKPTAPRASQTPTLVERYISDNATLIHQRPVGRDDSIS